MARPRLGVEPAILSWEDQRAANWAFFLPLMRCERRHYVQRQNRLSNHNVRAHEFHIAPQYNSTCALPTGLPRPVQRIVSVLQVWLFSMSPGTPTRETFVHFFFAVLGREVGMFVNSLSYPKRTPNSIYLACRSWGWFCLYFDYFHFRYWRYPS